MGLSGSKIGFNGSVPTTAFTIISNVTVTDPLGEQAKVISTSINDTSTGTGIQKVKIRYIDTNQNFNNEIVTTNGTSPVLTSATNILRIESFEVFKSGTPLSGAAGTIKLQSTDGTRLFAQIDIGGNQFLRSLHFVAPGKVADITDVIVSSQTSGGVSFIIFKEVDNTLNGGGIVVISDMSFTLVSRVMQLSLFAPVRCDATLSTQPLRTGISALGLVAGQVALVSFKFQES